MATQPKYPGKDDQSREAGRSSGESAEDIEVRSRALTEAQRRADEEQLRPRPLEGMSGMVPGTQRRDNLDSRPDFFTEFGDTSASTTEVMEARHYPEDDQEAREEQRELGEMSTALPHRRNRR